jgi:hypothetical protein
VTFCFVAQATKSLRVGAERMKTGEKYDERFGGKVEEFASHFVSFWPFSDSHFVSYDEGKSFLLHLLLDIRFDELEDLRR